MIPKWTILLLAAFFSLAVTALPKTADAGTARGRPKRTGQTSCWNSNGDPIACAGTGQDGELRRGLAQSYLDNGDGTITDRKSALTWEKLSDDGSIHDWDATHTWANAFSKIAALNTPPCFAGQCDWRLPNLNELESIRSLEGDGDPAVAPAFHAGCAAGCTVLTCSCTRSEVYWSSSSVEAFSGNAWLVEFLRGSVGFDVKIAVNHVRAVRGGA